MKPELEHIEIIKTSQSFKFFKTITRAFTPYWHYHPELELTLILKGQGTRFIGDSILPFGNLDLVIVGSNLPHHWVSQPDKKEQIAYVCQFSEQMFSSFQECIGFKDLFLVAQRGIQFRNPPKDLISHIVDLEKLNPVERLSSLLLILQTLADYQDIKLLASDAYRLRQERTASQLKFARINNYILEHLDRKLSVKEVSEIAHMVPQSFCRWFKKNSGHSFVNFINITRIENASQLLLTKDLSIQSIAFSCGFESISHFNRTFKKLKKQNPSSFRKKAKGR